MDEGIVTLWLDLASHTLQKAQKICTLAQKLLQVTSQKLSIQLPDQLEYADYIAESLKRQQQIVHTVVESLQSRVENMNRHWNEQRTKLLEPAIKELDSILAQLQKTKVPSYLVEGESSEEERDLRGFISLDAIDLLKENIRIYQSNCRGVMTLILEQLQENIIENYLVSTKRYNKLLKQYNEVVPVYLNVKHKTSTSPFEITNLINSILKENVSLEHELVSILKMLTNHYDQCSQGVQLFKQGKSAEIDLKVLETDSLELPDVLKELTTVYDIIVNNEARAQKFLQSTATSMESSISMIKVQLAQYRSFKSIHVFRFLILFSRGQEILNNCSLTDGTNSSAIEIYSNTIRQLVYHYTQFFQVYKTKYLAELHHEQYIYPRKFFKRLTDFLNHDLQTLQQEEAERRRKWLSKYGDFIPKEFKLPGEYNQPAISQVITEGLDDIQKLFKDGTFAEDANERKLIELMMAMKSLK
ncbi:uncharacterized protein PRCAT00003795001 [Priceomyces carsonii]|uniref:uncharacterized protein n=1 Tax=Priceomyces carsonii TaxID=28549 RepID=UPI002EDAA45B|nr:unnamed protein product [Priceomyces carsonii]